MCKINTWANTDKAIESKDAALRIENFFFICNTNVWATALVVSLATVSTFSQWNKQCFTGKLRWPLETRAGARTLHLQEHVFFIFTCIYLGYSLWLLQCLEKQSFDYFQWFSFVRTLFTYIFLHNRQMRPPHSDGQSTFTYLWADFHVWPFLLGRRGRREAQHFLLDRMTICYGRDHVKNGSFSPLRKWGWKE